MLLSAVFFLVVAQSSSEVPEGLMNNPVFTELKQNLGRQNFRNDNQVEMIVTT